ncbi:hypothetical protein P9112_008977 [Eukaryota sp. TZLM1-RC]
MKVAITGATGFVGRVVLRHLADTGNTINIITRNKANFSHSYRNVTVYEGSIYNFHDLLPVFKDCEVVLHMACMSSWDEIGDPKVKQVAVEGSITVARAARENCVPRLIYISSAAAVGYLNSFDVTRHGLGPESYLSEPTDLWYAEAKLLAERELNSFCTANNMDLITLCPGEIYGPNDYKRVTAGNIETLLYSAMPITVASGGVSVTSVLDVASAIVSSITNGKPGTRYLLGGENLTMIEFAKLVRTVGGLHRLVVPLPAIIIKLAVILSKFFKLKPPVPEGLVPYLGKYWWIDSTLAIKDLAYEPRSANETVQSVITWLRNERK